MPIENSVARLLLTAQTFNPSIFTETWLARNSVVPPDALVGVRVFSPDVAQFQTADLQVLIVPPQMQVTFTLRDDDSASALPLNIATRTVALLPHTPYQALGINFDFFVSAPAARDFNAYTRALLGSGDCALLREFSAPDAKFGRYFSKDHGNARLKLSIRPVQAGPENKEVLQFSFNFHHAVSGLPSEERPEALARALTTWGSLRKYANDLLVLGTRV